MKKLSVLGIVVGAALLSAAPLLTSKVARKHGGGIP